MCTCSNLTTDLDEVKSNEHDPFFRVHQNFANPRILEKSKKYVNIWSKIPVGMHFEAKATSSPNLPSVIVSTINIYFINKFYHLSCNKHFLDLAVSSANGHMCLLQESRNSSDGLQWSLSLKERCLCHAVTAPLLRRSRHCFVSQMMSEPLWFTSDPSHLTRRENWTPEKLDELLERKAFCGTFTDSCDHK